MAEPIEHLLARWTAEGLLDESTAARIRAFEAASSPMSRVRWPLRLALGFGAIAMGAGLLLFVSAHWDELSPGARFGLVVTLVGVFHVVGALLWERFPSTAVTLHAVGTMALGAGIYLAGQIFNLEEHWPNGLLLWSIGAALAWALLRSWPQLLLAALLAPAWLVGEWMLANEGTNSSIVTDVMASGVTLLALVGWTAALGIPLIVGACLRGRHAWPLGVAAVWMVTALQINGAGTMVLYTWFGLGAVSLTAWGVMEGRVERINLGAALFGATVIAFYLSEVMDKLGRAASLIGLGRSWRVSARSC
jgi:hypothetical protein